MRGKDFDELGRTLKKLPVEIRTLIEKRVELTLIVFSEQASSIASKQIYKALGVIVLAVGGIVMLFGIAHLIGEWLDSRALGFIITALPILIFGAMLISLRPKVLVKKIREEILQQMLVGVEQATKKSRRLDSSEKNTQHVIENTRKEELER